MIPSRKFITIDQAAALLKCTPRDLETVLLNCNKSPDGLLANGTPGWYRSTIESWFLNGEIYDTKIHLVNWRKILLIIAEFRICVETIRCVTVEGMEPQVLPENFAGNLFEFASQWENTVREQMSFELRNSLDRTLNDIQPVQIFPIPQLSAPTLLYAPLDCPVWSRAIHIATVLRSIRRMISEIRLCYITANTHTMVCTISGFCDALEEALETLRNVQISKLEYTEETEHTINTTVSRSNLPKWKNDSRTWLAMVESELNILHSDGDNELAIKVASKLAESVRDGGDGRCTTSPSVVASNLKVELREVHEILEKLENLGVISEYNPAGFQGDEQQWKRVDINKGIGTKLLICHEISEKN